jgi:hypothetical protein
LQRELRQTDPDATVKPTIESFGLLRLDVRSTVIRRRDARAAANRYEARAATMCEMCGEPVSGVRFAGAAMVLIRCDHCVGPEQAS